MSTKLAITAVWILSVAAAFWIGRATVINGMEQGVKALDNTTPEESQKNIQEHVIRESPPVTAYESQRMDAASVPNLVRYYVKLAPSVETDRKLRELWEQWGTTDPRAAISAAETLSGRDRQIALSSVVAVWARADAAAAWQWARQQAGERPTRAHERHFATIVNGALQSGRAEIVPGLLSSLPAGTTRSALLGVYTLHLARYEPDSIGSFLSSLPPSELTTVAGTLAREWSRDDPAATVAWASQLGGTVGEGALRTAVQSWAESDIDAVRTWMQQQQPSRERDQLAASTILRTPSATTEPSASLIQEVKDPVLRDLIATRKAAAIQQVAPAIAIRWAELISDPRQRVDAIARHVSVWAKSDPAAARRAIASSTALNESEKARLLSQMP